VSSIRTMGAGEEATLTGYGAAGEWDLVVPADGDELLAELDRHGVKPGHRVHLRAVVDVDGAAAAGIDRVIWADDLATAHGQATAAKHPPFRSGKGLLAGVVPVPSWEEFEAAGRLAARDAEASGTLPG
jgi:hypothetical protein